MVKRCLIVLTLIAALLLGTVSAVGTSQPPYAIRVNRAANTVTIYALDEQGQYTVPFKAMICSTARAGYVTPLGEYRLADYRTEWQLMLDGTYGQYATSFSGNYLFHSICYSDDAHDCMVRDAYNNLGEAASMGCVRLETADAKWIFDNCPAGTPVTVYDDADNPGPLGKPQRTVDYISEADHNGWDPTDPAEGNPWHQIPADSITLNPFSSTVTAGESKVLMAVVQPADAPVTWSSSDSSVVQVSRTGKVLGLRAGTAEITVRAINGVQAACTVTVTGELLPFTDLVPGAWYYGEVRKALDAGLFHGLDEDTFAPNEAMTRAMVVQVLYNLEGKPTAPETLPFTDVAETAWYRDAVAWAAAEGIVNGISETLYAPSKAMTRQELAAVLWRYAGSPLSGTELTDYTDAGSISEYAVPALQWMVAKSLMQGSEGQLRPGSTASRIETAAIIQRAVSAGWR